MPVRRLFINLFIWGIDISIMAKKKDERKGIFDIFGIKARTKKQKKFIKWFVVIKTLVYLVIFILAIIFLLRLRNLGRL